MTKIVLDANAYSALFKGDERVRAVIGHAEHVAVPVFVLAELLYGFKEGSRYVENMRQVEEFLNLHGIKLVQTTKETASIFSDIRHELK